MTTTTSNGIGHERAKQLHKLALRSRFVQPHWAFAATPAVLPERDLHTVLRDCRALFRLLLRLPELLFDGSAERFAAATGATPAELETLRRLSLPAPAEDTAIWPLRWDFVMTADGPKIMELNAGIALGGLAGDELQHAYDGMPEYQGQRYWTVGPALTGAVRRRCGHAATIAVVDSEAYWLDTEASACQIVECLRPHTDAQLLAGPASKLDVSTPRPRFGAQPVDALVEVFALAELATEAGLAPYVAAVTDGRLRPTVSMWCDVLASKACLALLHRYADLAGGADAELIRRLVPRVDLLAELPTETLRARRTDLVLKPSRGFGGIGVIGGVDTDERTWLEHCARLTRDDPAAVVQQRVHRRGTGDYVLVSTTGEVSHTRAMPVYGLYLIGDEPAGAFARVAGTDPLVVNAAAGAFVGVLRCPGDQRPTGGAR